jgi:hypothetical protein
MTTAQILFEQYKVLPPRVQQKLKNLILEDKIEVEETDDDDEDIDEEDDDDDENGDTIRISLKALHESIEAVKLLKAGKMETHNARQMVAEVERELANEH